MQNERFENSVLKAILVTIAVVPILYFNQIENVPIKAFILGSGSWGIGLVFKMISHQLIVVKLHKKKVPLIYESIANGVISGLFELLGAFVVIVVMLPKFAFNYNSIICFGLAIGSLETIIVAFGGDNLLTGTTLESSSVRLSKQLKNSEGIKYYSDNYALPVIERILATFIHISTCGMIFLTIITNSIFPALVAFIVFIIADGLLGYYYVISGKIITRKDLYRLYIYLFILTVISTIYFFVKIDPYKDIAL
jgi:hypothetical protein